MILSQISNKSTKNHRIKTGITKAVKKAQGPLIVRDTRSLKDLLKAWPNLTSLGSAILLLGEGCGLWEFYPIFYNWDLILENIVSYLNLKDAFEGEQIGSQISDLDLSALTNVNHMNSLNQFLDSLMPSKIMVRDASILSSLEDRSWSKIDGIASLPLDIWRRSDLLPEWSRDLLPEWILEKADYKVDLFSNLERRWEEIFGHSSKEISNENLFDPSLSQDRESVFYSWGPQAVHIISIPNLGQGSSFSDEVRSSIEFGTGL